MEIDEDVEDFVGECLDNLNPIQAVRSVEERINTKLPQTYVDFLLTNCKQKQNEMSKIVDEFYQII